MEINYNVRIEIKTLPITANFLAFLFKSYRNGNLDKNYQGVTTIEDFAEINEYGEFKTSKISFWPKDLIKMHQISPHDKNFDEKFVESIIHNAYDIVEKGDWKKNYFFGRYDGCSEDFIGIDESYEPKAMYLDYMAGIDESKFNLQEVLNKVKTSENVICLSDEIEKIPWYNSEEGRTQHIRFIFIPTKEQYKTYHRLGSFERYKKVYEILGLNKFKVSKN